MHHRIRPRLLVARALPSTAPALHAQSSELDELKAAMKAKQITIADEIDTVLAGHDGLTAGELDFILNYDIKCRLGRSTGEEEDK